MKNSPPPTWSSLSTNANRVRQGDERSEEAPFGFATRVVAHWQDLQRSERFRFWGVWTYRSALASLILCALAGVWRPSAEASPDPLEDLPTLSIPTP